MKSPVARRGNSISRFLPFTPAQCAIHIHSLLPMTMERIRIADIAFGGDGVGKLADGSVVFVPFTAVGDDVTIDVTERKQSFARAVPVQVNEAGPGRVRPLCKYFGRCGGCAYQHLDYPTEIAAKTKQFKDILARLGRFDAFPEPVVVPAPQEYEYRNKLRLEPANRTLENDGYHLEYGYCERDNETFFFVRNCPLARPELNKLLPKAIRSDWGRQNAKREKPYTLTLRIATDGTTGFYFGRPSPKLPWFRETLNDRVFKVPTGSFWQVNPDVASSLLKTVSTWLEPIQAKTLVDAYGGVGTFSLALDHTFAKHILIEADPSAVTAAEHNFADAGLKCQLIQDNTEDALPKLLPKLKPANTLVVLDPPRTGCHQRVLETLRKCAPQHILYVSCNVATLARDLKLLCAGNLYTPTHSGLFDMFPKTAHFECVVCLTRTFDN